MNWLFSRLFGWSQGTPRYEAERPLYGVNLGGWLVLEKWMTPSLFAGMSAVDEYTFSETASDQDLQRLRSHRQHFITKADFVWLKNQGIEAVRLPVGYWAFGDEAPYVGCIEYIDRAFQWAEQTGLKVLLDMHGASGSQNGKDHSGQAGGVGWQTDERHIAITLNVLTRLTQRYGHEPSLWGIELLNEPSGSLQQATLLQYYEAAYQMIRAEADQHVQIIFSDGFQPRRWQHQLRPSDYPNICLDSHQYQTFSQADKKLDINGHLQKTLHTVPQELYTMQRYHPVVVGEWSLALDSLSLQGLDATGIEVARRAYGAAQLLAYTHTSAWFYWNYKTEGGGVWSFRDCIDKGWLPRFHA